MIKTIRYNNKQLFVEHQHFNGNRPTLIFLHDSLGCTQLWRNFPHQMAAKTNFNWLSYDRLGYGKSDPMDTFVRPVNYLEKEADILIEIIDKLQIKNPVLFGHSDGGSIALWAASKYPAKLKAIIVEAAHIFVEDETLKGIKDAINIYKTTDLKQKLEKYHGDKVETIFKAWTEIWMRDDFRNWSIEHILHNIACPVLFIQGEKDEYGTLLQVEKTLEKMVSDAEKFIIPNIGHTPHKVLPDLVLKRSADFLERLS